MTDQTKAALEALECEVRIHRSQAALIDSRNPDGSLKDISDALRLNGARLQKRINTLRDALTAQETAGDVDWLGLGDILREMRGRNEEGSLRLTNWIADNKPNGHLKTPHASQRCATEDLNRQVAPDINDSGRGDAVGKQNYTFNSHNLSFAAEHFRKSMNIHPDDDITLKVALQVAAEDIAAALEKKEGE